MAENDKEKVAVVGVGQMGYGIGLEFARFGYEVSLYGHHAESLKKAMSSLEEDLAFMVDIGFLSDKTADATRKRLRTSSDIADAVKGAGYVVEAVTEKLSIKQEVFRELDQLCPPSTIFATNTSGLLVSDIAYGAQHPERFVSAHYFHPPHFVPLVEVSGGQKTDKKFIEQTAEILRGLRKRVVVIDKEIPGFIGNRLQLALYAEIKSLIDQGVCTPQMIDDVISFGFGRRLTYVGYFKRLDMIGIDFWHGFLTSSGQEPWPPLAGHYHKGEFGMKTGKGFYEWPGDSADRFQRKLKSGLLRLMQQDMEDGEI